jgi:hypothetical protein
MGHKQDNRKHSDTCKKKDKQTQGRPVLDYICKETLNDKISTRAQEEMNTSNTVHALKIIS